METSNDLEEEDDRNSAMENLTIQQVLTQFEDPEGFVNQPQPIGSLVHGRPSTFNTPAAANRPGTLDADTLELMLAQANETFVPTRSFKDIRRLLEKNSHVTICGASGEGKTMMALMLAQKYKKQGYEIVFVNKPDVFDLGSCYISGQKICLIFDDIFSSVGQSTDLSNIQSLCNSLKMHIDHSSLTKLKDKSTDQKDKIPEQTGGKKKCHGHGISKHAEEKGLRVIFTTKTYNLKEGKSKKQYPRSMFTSKTVVDLTVDPERSYSHQEKKEIFQKHREMHHKTKFENFKGENVIYEESTMFGFPLTCRLFFEFSTFTEKAFDFFKRPLYYLRIELNDIISRRNDQAAALILTLLCEENIKLPEIETPNINKKIDEMIVNVSNFTNSTSRSGVAHAARSFRGTFLSRGDKLCFSHSSIYEACACVLYQFNPSFVLKYCSLDFLYERLKPGQVDESRLSDQLHYLFVSEEYFHLVVTRLITSMKQGIFSKTVAHPLHQNEGFVEHFLEELGKSTSGENNWVQVKEEGKGFLYWIVKSKSIKLIQRIEKVLCINFSQEDIIEAIFASTECDSLAILNHLVGRLKRDLDQSILNKLILVSAEKSSKEIVGFFLKKGDMISGTDTKNRNVWHLLCIHDRPTVLKLVIAHFREKGGYWTDALEACDKGGRTPLMLAALHGTWDCFKQIQNQNHCTLSDNHGDKLIHLACMGGNRDIIERILTMKGEDINSRGQYGCTPIMVAAREAKSEVFNFLLSNKADTKIVDDNGNTLLHLACVGGSKHIVERLLTPENINKRGYSGRTPIMTAAAFAKPEVFDLLLSNNADKTLVDDNRDTLLHLACLGGSIHIIKRLLTPENINSRGQFGRTPIMTAAAIAKPEVLNVLLSNNADETLFDDDGNTWLHLACLRGNKHIVKRFLTLENINSRDQFGRTPIMTAAAQAKSEVFDLLLSNNADKTLVDDNGDTLLHLACVGGNIHIVERLLTPENINSRGFSGRKPIMTAAAKANPEVFNLLLSKEADTTLVDDNGNTLLHIACVGGSKHIVESLLTTGNINSRSYSGRTPLMTATSQAKLEVFELLLSNNADKTLVDDYGDTLLHLACLGGSKHIVVRLVTPENINTRGYLGRTPIMTAAAQGKPEVFDLLLYKKADTTLFDDEGGTLLHLACVGGSKHIVERLLTPENINSRGYSGRTPIMTAAAFAKPEVFDLLLSNNAEKTLVDENRDTLLHLACVGGSKHIVERLLTPENINRRGYFGRTPIMTAAAFAKPEVFDLLLSKNADTTLVDDNGNTWLHLACLRGNKHIVERFLTLENINSRDQFGRTPIMTAAAQAKSEVFDLLLSNNADKTLVDDNRDTLLHLACLGGSIHIIKRLLTPENINRRGQFGRTPIMTAAAIAKPEVLNVLLSNNADETLFDDDGNTWLHLACLRGNKHIVERFLTLENINSRDQFGRTPIMTAAAQAKSEVFDLLLSNNADKTLVDDNGDTLLHLACVGGNIHIVERLLTPKNINSRGFSGRKPIMTAAAKANPEVFNLLLSKEADTTLVDDNGNTLLHLACVGGSKHIVERLLTPENINRRSYSGRTPLMTAAAFAKPEVFDLLLSKNADATLVDDNRDTLLHLACVGGSKHIVERLLTPENINRRGYSGRTPIMTAAAFANPEVFDLLLSKYADTTLVDDNGNTLLHLACVGGSKYIVERLLTPENINRRGYSVRTPIMTAAAFAKPEVFDLLLSKNADKTLVDEYGNTLLHLACLGGSIHIIERLLTPENINSRGYSGRTPLMTAAAMAKPEVLNVLLSNNADETLLDDDGNTWLHLACLRGSKHIVERFLTPENINSRGFSGRKPIMTAAAKANPEVFNLLLSKGADTTLVDDNGNTLLHLACVGGSKHIVERLLTTENINSRSYSGRTPIMTAASQAKSEVFKLLLSNNADKTLVDDYGDTLLHLACVGGSEHIVERLLTTENINSRGYLGRTPIMTAAAQGKPKVFCLLLYKKADTTLFDDKGGTLLHLACVGGSKHIVERLLTPENINSRGNSGRTPIMTAAAFAKPEVFDFLLTNNADKTLVDNNGNTLLHLACLGGSKHIVERLVTPENINSRGYSGRTPIMIAASEENTKVFDLLLSNNADTTVVDEEGDTLLHLACLGGSKHIVERLLTPENINTRGYLRRTPIMSAASEEKEKVFDLLLSNNADITLVDEEGDTLLHLACLGGSKHIVERLLTPENINTRGYLRRTPIMSAASEEKEKVFDLLLSNNADITLVDEEGDTLLHLACLGGSKHIVDRLLTPENINTRGYLRRTPIMTAASEEKEKVFDLLLSNNADITLVDEEGDTLLHLACLGGSKHIVDRLLTLENINTRGYLRRTPIMTAASEEKEKVFDLLLSNNADITLVDEEGDTLLHLACLGGSKHIVDRLLTPENIDRRGCSWRTPIMTAAAQATSEVFDLLLSNNADTTLVDDNGNTLLHLACRGGSIHIIERLLTPENINSRGYSGRTPIMIAASEEKTKVFDLLLSNNADTTLVDDDGNTLLHLACRGGSIHIVERLLTPENINSRGYSKRTPIMTAAAQAKSEVFDFLLSNNANTTLVDDNGNTLLHLACRGGSIHIVERLLTPENINSRGYSKRTPIMTAAAQAKSEVFDFLLSNNANTTLVDDNGNTLLHLACRGGSIHIVERLLTPENINSRGCSKRTPIMTAAAQAKSEVFDLLLSNNADNTLVDYNGNTLLHLACRGGSIHIVERLLTPENINSRADNGGTPIMAAAFKGHTNILELLYEKGAELTCLTSDGMNVLAVAKSGGKQKAVKYLKSLLKS